MIVRTSSLIVCAVAVATTAAAAPHAVEISEARPAFVFAAPDSEGLPPNQYATVLIETWSSLPIAIQERGCYSLDISEIGPDLIDVRFVLSELQRANISVSLTVARNGEALGIETLFDLLIAHPNVLLLHAADLPMATPPEFGGLSFPEAVPAMRWLNRVLDITASEGRILQLELDAGTWIQTQGDPRLRVFKDLLWNYSPYVAPLYAVEDPRALAATSALTGLWYEERCANWGMAISAKWFEKSDFVRPGTYGPRQAGAHMPPPMYRAMIFSGAMNGATVYRFDAADDLWFGGRGYQWSESILPALSELLDSGGIPRKSSVARAAQGAYQLEGAFDRRVIAEDLDAVIGNGRLQRTVHGINRSRVDRDLFPNAGGVMVPILSAEAPAELLSQFESIYRPGLAALDASATDASADVRVEEENIDTVQVVSSPAVTRVGRSVFVMHTEENRYERQAYTIAGMPAPVRDIRVQRMAEGVQLSWPFRENDFAYTVYRRVLPATQFEPIAKDVDLRSYVDRDVRFDETVAYSLTALTNEVESLNGTLNWGEYLLFSTAISRIEEEVIVYPETEIATSAPVTVMGKDVPDRQVIWPAIDSLNETDAPKALAVAARIDALGEAILQEDAGAIETFFAADYAGADGSNAAFARAWLRAFVDRYSACRLFVQPHDWAVEPAPGTAVAATLYVHLSGVEHTADGPRIARYPAANESVVTWIFEPRDGAWSLVSSSPPFPALADFDL